MGLDPAEFSAAPGAVWRVSGGRWGFSRVSPCGFANRPTQRVTRVWFGCICCVPLCAICRWQILQSVEHSESARSSQFWGIFGERVVDCGMVDLEDGIWMNCVSLCSCSCASRVIHLSVTRACIWYGKKHRFSSVLFVACCRMSHAGLEDDICNDRLAFLCVHCSCACPVI